MSGTKGAGAALAVVASALGIGVAPASAATLRATERITVRTAAVTGSLRLVAQTAGAQTTLIASGTLTARSSSVRLVVWRCRDAACSAKRLVAVGGATLRRGRSSPRLSWSTATAARLRVQLRVGKGTLVSSVLRPTAAPVAPAPVLGATPQPATPASAPPTAASAPAPADAVARTITADPGLVPAYDPQIPDFTVRCLPGQAVRLRATLPATETIAIDGAPATSGTVLQDVALQPGQAFAFTVDGTERHVVRCLPADFPRWSVQRAGRADVAWMLLAPTVGLPPGATPYATIVDRFGVPVWWMTSSGGAFNETEVLGDGSVALGLATGGAVGFARSHYERYALDGTPLGTLDTVGMDADDHEIAMLPNGDVLLEAYVPRPHVDLSLFGGPVDATVVDAEIQEVTPDGGVAWSWRSQDHIGLEETADWGLGNTTATLDGDTVYDLVHLNAIEPLADGDLVISARHLDAVYRIRRSDGAVLWKLGGTPRPESLTFVGDPVGHLAGQHDARVLSDGTLTVHDNESGQLRPPRAVRYRIDPVARTATMVEQVTDARVLGSFCCGSARRLPGGHWLVGWGGSGTSTELTATGEPVLTLSWEPPVFSYRTIPVTNALVDRTALRAAMDAQHPRAVGG